MINQGWRAGVSFGSEPKRIFKTFGYFDLSLSIAQILKEMISFSVKALILSSSITDETCYGIDSAQ